MELASFEPSVAKTEECALPPWCHPTLGDQMHEMHEMTGCFETSSPHIHTYIHTHLHTYDVHLYLALPSHCLMVQSTLLLRTIDSVSSSPVDARNTLFSNRSCRPSGKLPRLLSTFRTCGVITFGLKLDYLHPDHVLCLPKLGGRGPRYS